MFIKVCKYMCVLCSTESPNCPVSSFVLTLQYTVCTFHYSVLFVLFNWCMFDLCRKVHFDHFLVIFGRFTLLTCILPNWSLLVLLANGKWYPLGCSFLLSRLKFCGKHQTSTEYQLKCFKYCMSWAYAIAFT